MSVPMSSEILGSTTPIADAFSTPKNTTQLTIARIAIEDRFEVGELFVVDVVVMIVAKRFFELGVLAADIERVGVFDLC